MISTDNKISALLWTQFTGFYSLVANCTTQDVCNIYLIFSHTQILTVLTSVCKEANSRGPNLGLHGRKGL